MLWHPQGSGVRGPECGCPRASFCYKKVPVSWAITGCRLPTTDNRESAPSGVTETLALRSLSGLFLGPTYRRRFK